MTADTLSETSPTTQAESATGITRFVWPTLRVAVSFVFLWAFLDKTFALGFATGRDPETGAVDLLGPAAWVSGGSPTSGFLEYGTNGPLRPLFSALAGSPIVDWLFMLGMGGVGVALLLGIATRIATTAGVALMVLLRLATWQSENNPVIDDHVIYALLLVGLATLPAARLWSVDPLWQRLPLVRRVSILR